jgi:hypothetical protein
MNWNIPVSLPRNLGGAISEMYNGATTFEIPILIPPMNLANIREYTPIASPDQIELIKQRRPISVFLRAHLSIG